MAPGPVGRAVGGGGVEAVKESYSIPFRALAGLVPSWRPGLISLLSLAFFLAIMFLTLVCVYITVRISAFERMLKDIGQELAMVELRIKDTPSRRDPFDSRKT